MKKKFVRPAIAAAVIVLAGVAVFAASIMLSGSSSSKG